jgi:hypothetical protein
MKRRITNTLFLIAAVALISVGSTFGQKRNLVGNLKFKTGSACGVYLKFVGQSAYSSKEIFYSSLADQNDTWMNIDGKDVRLKFISVTEPTKPDGDGGELIGSRTTEKYAAGNINVEIVFTVSWLCPNDNAAKRFEPTE